MQIYHGNIEESKFNLKMAERPSSDIINFRNSMRRSTLLQSACDSVCHLLSDNYTAIQNPFVLEASRRRLLSICPGREGRVLLTLHKGALFFCGFHLSPLFLLRKMKGRRQRNSGFEAKRVRENEGCQTKKRLLQTKETDTQTFVLPSTTNC